MKKTMLLAVLALLCSAPKHAHATNDGTPSTGSFTVVNVSSLSAAAASGSLAVVDRDGSLRSRVVVGSVLLTEGREWRVGTTTVTAATSLKNAINAANVPVTATYVAGMASITLASDDVGTFYNGIGLRSSTPTALSVSSSNLTGGQDNAVIQINGIPLMQGRDWFVQDVASNTAVNLAAAINHNDVANSIVSATWLGGSSAVVLLRSVLSPLAYTLASSAPSDLTRSQAAMSGGSSGNITPSFCFLGSVNALPTTGYPAGCLLFLNSDPTKVYLSTQAVTGAAASAANSWLAK